MTREPEIERIYVQTGKVRFVARDFAFLGQESFWAAEASRAAAAQGKYWEYRRLLFQRQRGENRGAFTTDNLKKFAAELGLDQAAFNRAMDERTYRSAVESESKEAETQGVKATPTFFINDRKLEGAPPVERMSQMIDEELAKKK